MTTTNELHAAIYTTQTLLKQAADVIEHNANSLAEAHARNGIIEDAEVQAAVESDIDLVAHLRAAALPWDQRQKPAQDVPEAKFGDMATPAQRVTDGQVEAALKAAHMHSTPESRKDMCRAIEAAAPQPSPVQQEPIGKAHLCDRCSTPFDGEDECQKCGHGSATKNDVYEAPQPIPSTITKGESRAQCSKCEASDPAITDVCQVPACGMREGG